MDTYHVVCHQCPEEAILDCVETAEAMAADHREATGHRMSIGSLSDPA